MNAINARYDALENALLDLLVTVRRREDGRDMNSRRYSNLIKGLKARRLRELDRHLGRT